MSDGFAIDMDRSARVLRIQGAMTFATAAQLYPQVLDVLRQQPVECIDLASATSVDSAGLACVLAWLAASLEAGRTLSVGNAPGDLRSLAQVSGTLSWVTADGASASAAAPQDA